MWSGESNGTRGQSPRPTLVIIMYHFFVSPEQVFDEEILITGQDVNHIRNVLRMKPGEEVRLCTGEDDRDYRCRIEEITEHEVRTRILWVERSKAELPCEITLFQGLPKSDKMELIIQKAVELGAHAIVPVAMHRCVTKLDAKKGEAKVKRWNAISESAAKQSKRMYIPPVGAVASFEEAAGMAQQLDVVLVPYELADDASLSRQALEEVQPGRMVGIFIGPEGGLEKSEVEMLQSAGAKCITLGRRILRTETAGMALLAHLMLRLELENA